MFALIVIDLKTIVYLYTDGRFRSSDSIGKCDLFSHTLAFQILGNFMIHLKLFVTNLCFGNFSFDLTGCNFK